MNPKDWIDRADQASQAGLPKPEFETEEGGHIFPEGDEPWWLTDVSRRAQPEEEAQGDEDGPASDMDIEEDQRVEVTDSEASEPGVGGARSLSSAHEPMVAWRN